MLEPASLHAVQESALDCLAAATPAVLQDQLATCLAADDADDDVQDSALDSLAAARQAVLQELPQAGGSSPMEASQPDIAPGRGPMQPTGDPLVQARWLVGACVDS